MLRPIAALLVSGLLTMGGPLFAADPKPVHGLAMHGAPKYPADFKHLDYMNPDAPKGGDVRFASIGTFDSLNPFILRGVPAVGLTGLFDTLLRSSEDEAFTAYGLLAETLEVPDDRSWVIFNLRPEARFHDGTSVTAEDVVWTFDTLRTKGRPSFRAYYADVEKAEALTPLRVKFTFKPGVNRELPLIIGQMSVLSKAYYQKVNFEQTSLEPPLGSGPYKVSRVEPGRSITYARDPNYWGKDLPINRGRSNFGTMRYDYYRDATVAVEALKAGQYDFRLENSAKNWSTEYDDLPALKSGALVKKEVRNEMPNGMQGFAFNLRRPIFQDVRVRKAIIEAFDFEWSNKTLFYGLYARTASYWSNSELAARGLPRGEELELLEQFRKDLPPELFTTEYKPPVTDGSGNLRDNIRTSLRLLREAGWEVKNNKLIETATGKQMEFEILLESPLFERIALPFIRNLERLGIVVKLRTIDPSQYQNRLDNFDYDMTVVAFGQSLSPGNEQREYFGSEAADIPGSRNVIGIKNKVIDALIDKVIAAPDRESLIQRTRALDRVLQWGHYVVPHFHSRVYRMVLWNQFGFPKTPPKYGVALDSWWIDPALQAALPRRPAAGQGNP
ncbi:MAG: extracellular solute-binding protein [Elsteraceae bacterium]